MAILQELPKWNEHDENSGAVKMSTLFKTVDQLVVEVNKLKEQMKAARKVFEYASKIKEEEPQLDDNKHPLYEQKSPEHP